MGSGQTDGARVRAQAVSAGTSALQSEIESVVLARAADVGGNIAQVARYRAFMTEALGIYGTVSDIVDMAVAGYEAMTGPRRMLMRVSAAHQFGYWSHQHLNLHNPINPPNAFLVMHRERDAADQAIGETDDNTNFSSDGGLTSVDWNIAWRSGVQGCNRNLTAKMNNMVRSGSLQRALQDRLGPNADIQRQSQAAMINQYCVLFMAPKFGSPAAAAGAFFLSSLQNATGLEKQMNLRLYRQFPYNPRRA